MDGNMRRLPPWMLAGASSDVTKTVEGKREATKTKAEKRPRRTVKPEKGDDYEEPKKLGKRRRGREGDRGKIVEEEAKPNIAYGKDPQIFQSMTGPEDEDLTVDDLLSFAQEYVKEGEEDHTRKNLSISESKVVVDETNMRSSQGEETNGTRDQTAADMLDLLLGPFFKNSQQSR